MKVLKKLVGKFSSKYDIMITLVGIALLILIVIIFLNPRNMTIILIACFACGSINILQGMKHMRDPKKRTTGMSYLMLGIIVIVVGFIITGVR